MSALSPDIKTVIKRLGLQGVDFVYKITVTVHISEKKSGVGGGGGGVII